MTVVEEPLGTRQWYVEAPVPARRRRRWIPVLFGLLLLAGAGGAGTVASFTASTENAGATFSVGTLVLSDQVGATACLSTDGGMPANAATCAGQPFAVAVAEPGDGASADITLENVGSMDGALALHAAGACVDTVSGTYHGSASLCGSLRLSVQEYADAGRTTPTTCLFGGGSGTTCDFSDPAATVAAFTSAYPDFNTTLPMGTMATSSLRYLRVSVELPSTVGNDHQGRTAAFGLTWRLVQ